jgi:acyl carrier protein
MSLNEVSMSTIEKVKSILRTTLQLGDRVADFEESTPLLGSLPELDSMAVVTLITSLEEYFGFVVDDDEIDGATFATVGTLTAFVEKKLGS